jgi:FemAB-related protein (PEP-CTERM system-associated)
MPLALRPLDQSSMPAWDAFVEAHPDGTFFHRAAWAGVIEAAFGHRAHYVLAERDGAIAGVLPLVHMKTRLFGNTLVSTPFAVYGGPLAADAETQAALAEHAAGLLPRLGATAVEFRFRDAPDGAADNALGSNWLAGPKLHVTFRKAIEADHDANLKAIPRKQRAMVRKGIQNGLTSVCDRDAAVLHRCYAESVRNLGTPVFSRRYFAILLDRFADCADVVTILDGDKPIASVLNFYFRNEVLPYYGGGTAEARHRAGNDFRYWEVMRRAADRGCRLFDFGRSKIDTGAHAFKRNWGFEPVPLHYRWLLAPGAAIPQNNPSNPKYRLFIAAWQKLPLPVANAIGPFIVRGLG